MVRKKHLWSLFNSLDVTPKNFIKNQSIRSEPNHMLLSVVFVSYNTAEMTIDALNSLFASKVNFEFEVIIIDNASSDNSVALIKKHFPSLTLIENKENVGFGRANNQALDVMKGDYLLLLNTDAFVEIDTLQKTVDYMIRRPDCGLLGVRLLGRDGVLQPSCRYFPTQFNLFADRMGLNRLLPNIKLVDDPETDHNITQECDWVPGCYYLLRKETIDEVGLFDPLYFLYSEEVDHCFSIKKAGWKVVYFADTDVIHIGGESAKSVSTISNVSRQVPQLQIESELLYFRKNHGVIGLFGHIFMSNLADIIQTIKDVFRLRGPKTTLFNLKRIYSFWHLYFLTQFATKSTR